MKRSIMFTRLLLAALLFIPWMANAAATDGSLSALDKAYYKAANEGRYDDVEKMYSESGLMMVQAQIVFPPQPGKSGGVKGQCEKDSKGQTITKVEIVKQAVKDKNATVTTRIHYKDGSTANQIHAYEKQNGQWKLMGLIDEEIL